MKPRLKSTRAARELIKAYEPFHGEAVRRGKRWVVGYGHTAAAKPGVTVKPEDAELLLIYDVLQAETAVHAALGEDMPGAMRDALVSFAASVGVNAFKVSDVARLARSGRHEAAAAALETWVRVQKDGRSVTSERLQKRRAAEKALYLQALGAAPAEAAPAPQPEPAPQAPEPEETPLEEAQTEDTQAEEPALGPLIDVDLSFEEPEAEPEIATAPESDAEPVAADADPEAPAEPVADDAAEAVDPEPAPEAETEAETAEADVQPEPAQESDVQPEPVADAGAVKAAQDAAIASVMSRMAGEIARSVSVAGVNAPQRAPDAEGPQPEPAAAPEAGPRADLSGVQLGYSFLDVEVIGWDYDAEVEPAPAPVTAPVTASASEPVESAEPEADPEPEPEAEAPAESAETEPAAETEIPAEAEGPGAPGSPAKPAPAPGPVYASVAVGPIGKTETAPPHPAEAPAPADGLSGESEGPDHGEHDEHAAETYEEEAELEPAIVAGAEATYVADEAPPAAVEGRGDWVYTANLLVGVGLIGFGAWEIVSNLDAYMAAGFDYSWLGPVAFGSGVLLSVASGWFVVGHLTRGKK
ncbi:MAG: glycoside hydrolase family protein [Oceanicaulis sp.]